jgi:hypothetical protein
LKTTCVYIDAYSITTACRNRTRAICSPPPIVGRRLHLSSGIEKGGIAVIDDTTIGDTHRIEDRIGIIDSATFNTSRIGDYTTATNGYRTA